jgi:hypothetical protein
MSDPAPQRIQISRAKNWKMPPNTVKVDRTTKWGNPYKEGITPGNYASWFRADLTKEMKSPSGPTEPEHPFSVHLWNIGQNINQLRGKNLACWCRPEAPCHADVLLELANPAQKDEG